MSQQGLLTSVLAALDEVGIEYMLTGSLVSSLQGEPRLTHDIDVVVALDPSAAPALARALAGDDRYIDRAAVADAAARGGMFNLIDVAGGDKVDFWMLAAEDPFDASRFARRIRVILFGVEVRVSAPEDTIMQKLRWCASAGGSERQLADAVGVYEVQQGSLDESYLDEWADRLGVRALLAVVRAGSGASPPLG